LKTARNSSLFMLILAAVLLAAGFACGGGDDKAKETATTAAPSDTATASVASATNTPPPTPSPTPTPYDGGVARMAIPRFGVDAPIEALTVNGNNEMETPAPGKELTDVGWYDSTIKPDAPFLGTRPGWEGNAVFAAHVFWTSIPAPFNHVASNYGGAAMVTGDDITVTMNNGLVYHYKALGPAKRYNRDTIPMGDIISPPDRPPGKQWITLITCGGQLDSTGQEYISRDVLVAERVS
jgi:hypothetical protein